MKKTIISYLCILSGIVFSINSNAQEKEYQFSLNQVINYALKHNKQIKNADLSIKAAEKQKWETIAIGLPHINGNISYQDNLRQQFDGIDFDQDGNIDFGAKFNVTPSATLTQLIFDGSYLVGLQASKVFLKISNNAKIKTDKEIVKAVTSAYSNVLLIDESISIFKKNIKNLETNITESKALFENGFIEQEAVEQLQITLNDLNNNLENLTNLKLNSLKMLKFLMGYDFEEKLLVSDNLNTLSNQLASTNNQFDEVLITDNIDYKISKNNTESKRLLYKLEQSKLLPSIGTFLYGSYIANSNEFSFFDNNQAWIPTSALGINIDIPIFSSFQKTAKIKRAKINWKIAENNLKNTIKEIDLKIENAKTELNLAIKTLNNKKQNLRLAEKIESKNNTKYKEGIASSFELRQAQTQLYTIQQAYLQAMVNVINKQANLNALKK